ncbi:hypothetical protein CH272_18590 [Rhodococcus sp. 05-340-1]|uniref:serine hydrolase domain-containing protein n=1 Tax=Nocardiaceae TaxID=85025 RepID=UPI00050C77DE|nr:MULTISPECIES: serine hydrolase domain-containing protein [Rhodococcus]OZC87719.1 hypothetical protein CH254_14210 [Rhodococcus sp. 06-412-2C]OZC96370.1 hypothetical protein CH279_14380 [Rhodococcus sp. 06-412-2B]OZD65354.1 hypothetical protein CH271_20200 [Rhodococcus sp. 05-340-2]OZD74600.1 hypothetical protein CH272_18590 [Rhodococcus sp. 05-340-1]OZD86627.1 hypothetical protein CH273_00435 [Rhodococcus sp. 05-339-2]
MSTEYDQRSNAVPATDPRITAALEESRRRGETGIQVAAYLNGELIVNAAAGNAAAGTATTIDTLFPVFSVTKAITSVALHLQAEKGLIDYNAPVAQYWPEFGKQGKETMTVRQLLSHRGGIPWMPDGVTPAKQADWSWMIDRIENAKPAFEPGTTNCYHALVWGWVVAEIVLRTDGGGRDFAQFLQQEIFTPMRIDGVHLGVPAALDDRVAVLNGGDVPEGVGEQYLLGMPEAVFPGSRVYNTELSRRTVNPGAGVIATAEGIARFFALLAGLGELDGVRLLSEDRVRAFTETRDHVEDTDLYMGKPAQVSAHGFWLGGPQPAGYPVLGDNPNVVHHPGAGGALGWAELDTGLAVSINHNAMHDQALPTELHPFTPIAEAVREVAAERAGVTS